MKESIFATGVKTQATSDSEPAAAAVTLYLVDDTAEQWVGNDNAVIEIVDNTHGHDHYVMKKNSGGRMERQASGYSPEYNVQSSESR